VCVRLVRLVLSAVRCCFSSIFCVFSVRRAGTCGLSTTKASLTLTICHSDSANARNRLAGVGLTPELVICVVSGRLAEVVAIRRHSTRIWPPTLNNASRSDSACCKLRPLRSPQTNMRSRSISLASSSRRRPRSSLFYARRDEWDAHNLPRQRPRWQACVLRNFAIV
jgi:hypothetical protein